MGQRQMKISFNRANLEKFGIKPRNSAYSGTALLNSLKDISFVLQNALEPYCGGIY